MLVHLFTLNCLKQPLLLNTSSVLFESCFPKAAEQMMVPFVFSPFENFPTAFLASALGNRQFYLQSFISGGTVSLSDASGQYQVSLPADNFQVFRLLLYRVQLHKAVALPYIRNVVPVE